MDNHLLLPGWDAARIRDVIDHYDRQTEDEEAAELEAAYKALSNQEPTQ